MDLNSRPLCGFTEETNQGLQVGKFGKTILDLKQEMIHECMERLKVKRDGTERLKVKRDGTKRLNVSEASVSTSQFFR